MTELNQLLKGLERFQVSAQEDYNRKYDELHKPIIEKAQKAIAQVAKKGGYKIVLDTSNGIVLYS